LADNKTTLQKKAEVFLEKIYPLLKNFPAAEKFCLCQEIKQAIYRLIRDTVMFTNIRTAKRMEYLQEADGEKTLLLTLFGVARNQKYITKGKALELQTDLAEIGRIIGGLQQAYYNKTSEHNPQSSPYSKK